MKTPVFSCHPALNAYATHVGVVANTPARSDGRLTVRVDGRWRVHLTGKQEGRIPSVIVISARLLDFSNTLKDDPAGELLVRLASIAAGRLKSDSSFLGIDKAGNALVLLQVLPANSDLEAVQSGLAEFVNALAFWGKVIEDAKPNLFAAQPGNRPNTFESLLFRSSPHSEASQSSSSRALPQVFFP